MSTPARARLLFLSVLLIDQMSKQWALSALQTRHINLFGPFTLRLVLNHGAAFGSLTSIGTLLAAVGTAVGIGGWVLTARRPAAQGLWIAVLAAGSMGNALDRIFRGPNPGKGAVVDFISVGSFPVFNVADAALSISVAALIAVSMVPRAQTSH